MALHGTWLSKCVMALLAAVFIIGVVLVVSFPFTVTTYMKLFPDYYGSTPSYRPFVIVFFMLAGALSLWILLELILMLRTVTSDPFVPRNVFSLKRMGYAAIAIAVMFIAKCFVYFTPLTIACGGALLLCGLFSLILSGVFASAVEYKRENDLTI